MIKSEHFRVMEQCGKITELRLKNGLIIELYLPEHARQRLPFENDCCQFTPVGWARSEGIWYPLGYKVVTTKMESVGTRGNLPLTFPVGEWVCMDNEEMSPSEADGDGIWALLRKGSLKNLKTQYMNAGIKTRGFLTAMYNPIYASSSKVKSQGMMILKEIKTTAR